MNDIHKIVAQASRRLWITDSLRALAVMLSIGLAALILARLTERLFGLAFPWNTIFISTGISVFVGSLTWTILARRRSLEVARILDERAGLRETLSTALYMEKSDDPWAKAVIQTALETAKKVNVGDAISIETPRAWPAPLAAAIAFMLIWKFFPVYDVLKINAEKVALQEKTQAIVEVKADIEQKQQVLREALAKANISLPELTPENKGDDKKADGTPKEEDPESLRRQAVKDLTNLTEKLQSQKEGEKAAQVDAQKEAMRQLKQPGDGPMSEFSRALARGDFNKAQEKLEQITKKLADGSLSEKEKQQAKEQLQNLSKQLKEMAENQSQVAKALEKAGLDKQSAEALAKQAAANPDALKKAVEKMSNMTPEQQQKMLDMAKAAQKACNKSGQMGESMSKMAQGISQEGLQQDGMEGMEDLSKDLNESEMMQEDMKNLDAAMEEAKSQLAQMGECLGGECDGSGKGQGKGSGTGGWKPGESAGKKGSGSGGPGQSSGGASPEAQAADFEYKKEKANTQTQGGPIIGSRLVYGGQLKGESTAEFATTVEASAKEASEAMDSMQIPREYHDAVKHYFGRMQEKVKKEPAKTSQPSTTPSPTSNPAK